MSPGLIVSAIFVISASYVYYRSWQFLRELLTAPWSGFDAVLRRLVFASGLTIMFCAGTLMMISGLTGLSNRLLVALQ
jgi:hypothetical protein